MSKNIYGKVPQNVRRRTYYLQKKYNLSLIDAFDKSVTECNFSHAEYPELTMACYFSDYRQFVPGEYLSKYLDFNSYPLPYEAED